MTLELLRAIQTGKRKEIRFTVPEGSSKVDIVKIIAKAGFGDEAKLIALMKIKTSSNLLVSSNEG